MVMQNGHALANQEDYLNLVLVANAVLNYDNGQSSDIFWPIHIINYLVMLLMYAYIVTVCYNVCIHLYVCRRLFYFILYNTAS